MHQVETCLLKQAHCIFQWSTWAAQNAMRLSMGGELLKNITNRNNKFCESILNSYGIVPEYLKDQHGIISISNLRFAGHTSQNEMLANSAQN